MPEEFCHSCGQDRIFRNRWNFLLSRGAKREPGVVPGSLPYFSFLTGPARPGYRCGKLQLNGSCTPPAGPAPVSYTHLGGILGVGFEKAYLMQNYLNLNVSEVISTYTYKIGLQLSEFSYSTAIGLFNTLINFIVLVIVNTVARRTSEISLW